MILPKTGNFQKYLTYLSVALLFTVALAKKKQNYPFPKGSGIVLNEPLASFDEEIKKSDHLIFVYVFDSTQDKSQQMTEQIINPTVEELKGYIKWYAFDCQDPDIKESKRFTMCEKEEYTPWFQLMKPPQLRINPYTKQPMAPENIPFNKNQVTQKDVQSFIITNLPDFTITIDSKKKAQEFKEAKDDLDINRVILFSKKSKTPPIYKVLSSEYRDRLRFGFVSSEGKQEVGSLFQDVNEFPSIIVVNSYDPESKNPLEQITTIKYDKKDYKLDELKEFLEPFARDSKKEVKEEETKKSDDSSSEKQRRKKAYAEIYNDRHFSTHILDNEKACLVIYILGNNITAEVPSFEKILKQTLGPLQVGVFYVNDSIPEFSEFKKKYKLHNKFPQMRFYKNNLLGEDKNVKSFEIYLKNKFDSIMDEIHESLDHDIKEVNEKILNNLAINHAVEEKKNVLIYFYQSGPVSLHFKAISALSILKDSFAFLSVPDPSQQLLEGFQIRQLPAIGGVIAATNEDPESIKQFTYGGNIEYEEILQNMLKLSGKEEEYEELKKTKKRQVDRKFEEITNQYKFQQNCLDRQKGCAIAFLPGNLVMDYERDNHQEYLAALEQLEKEAKSLPVYYMWVNATCHNYLLTQFDVNPMFVPTVVFYLPQKDKSAHLIGKFDKETIQKHEQKFANGKLPTFEMKTKSTEIEIKDIDCANLQPIMEVDEESKALDDEILREILEEEKMREKEEELRYKKKDKKKKKAKSSKKEKDDL